MGADGQIEFKNVEAVDMEAAKRRLQEILPPGTTVEKILRLPEDPVDDLPRIRPEDAEKYRFWK